MKPLTWLILPPATVLIRASVDAYLVSLALRRGICLASDSLWFISRGVVLDEVERGLLVEFPTGARFLSGAVGMTRRQAAATPGLATLEQVARQIAGRAAGGWARPSCTASRMCASSTSTGRRRRWNTRRTAGATA
ncbi:hypothetical protein LOS78_01250 [Paracoccus sp. MA]|uniref:hypothetical protein n=1 Tax=Paracoccus sp. MA TaxID=2895796 RepID=UPI001E4194BC|nr:hypothetical protein [Paracoccus sp. MA]UFM64601.1 hypothetical protein LOS78_01250 [Paracoccus sp. MA]